MLTITSIIMVIYVMVSKFCTLYKGQHYREFLKILSALEWSLPTLCCKITLYFYPSSKLAFHVFRIFKPNQAVVVRPNDERTTQKEMSQFSHKCYNG